MSVDITALSIQVTSSGITEASRALGGLSTSAANTTRRVEALIVAMQRLGNVTNTINMVGGGAGALTNALNQLNATLNLLNQRTTQTTQSQRQHNESMREAHALARGLSGSLGALWVTYGNFAGLATGLAIGTALKGIVTVGVDVEHTLEGIRIRGQESMKSIDEMRESIMAIGQGVHGPQAVAHALETLVLAGLNAEQALVSVNAALNLAVVGGTTIEKSATTLVGVGSAIGYVADGYDRIADVIAKTAALSMSSVESLSEAFKSGSSVAKLYGVTLEDIGTNLGVLSNLGIQGSAAGTAMKNFYKELAAGSEKVTKTLKDMGLSQKDFKDSEGYFLPILDVVGKLDEGLKKLDKSQRQVAIANLTNERGLRLGTQLLGEYNTKVGESSNALAEFRKAVEDSHGFASIGAVAMSLTAQSQIKSMLNSLKASFAETFTEMQPEIIAFTGRMKSIFASQEFKSALITIAQGFANLALAIANNLPLITAFVVGLTAVKTLMGLGAMVTLFARGIQSLGIAFYGAAAGAVTLNVALGAIGVVLSVVAAGYVLYNSLQADSNKHTQMAVDYSKGYLDGLKEEADRLTKVNEQLDKKKTLQEATAEIERNIAREKMNALNKKAVEEAQDNLDNGIKWTGYTKIAQTEALRKAQKKLNDDNLTALREENRIKEQNRQIDVKVKAQALANRESPEGTGTLGGDVDKAAINDAYRAALEKHFSAIESAKKEARNFDRQQEALVRAGEISRLEFLENTLKKEEEMYKKSQAARRAAQGIAQGAGNKSDAARLKGDIEQAEEDMAAKRIQNEIDTQGAVNKYVREATKFRIAELEKQHEYGKAAQLRWSEDNNKAMAEAKLAAEKYGDVFPVLHDVVRRFGDAQKEAVREGFNREAVRDFNILADETSNLLKSVTSVEGQGLADLFNAANESTAIYQTKLEDLREAMKLITDPKDLAEAQARMTGLANNERKKWASVGETIGESLEAAFGRGGKALGDLIKAGTNYQNLENKTASARIRAYGDAAGAAKSFFKEGTSGYKVMEIAEQAFRAAELAGMAKSLAMTISNATASATAWIPAVMMSFMGSMGPWGLAAAGVAIAAVLGHAAGGSTPPSSQERQKKQGTGSVLGDTDAKSDSIAKSLEIMEKNSGLGLAQGSQMVSHLKTVANSLSGLASLIVRTTGITGAVNDDRMTGQAKLSGKIDGSFGLLSKYSEKITNALFGGKVSTIDTGFTLDRTTVGGARNGVNASQYSETKKDGGLFRRDKYSSSLSSLGEDANGQFSMIIEGMAKSLTSAAALIGLGGDAFTNKLESFVIDIGKVSLKGLSAAEIKEELQAVFSKVGDDMAKFALSELDQFQQIGEGYLETVVRVANNLSQVKDVFAILGKELTLTGVAAIKVSESLVASAGSIEKLTEGTKYFMDNFLTEAERMDAIGKSVTTRLSELNMSELTSVELYKKKIQALDLTVAADQKMYVALLELAPAFKEVSDYADETKKALDELTKKQRELDIQLMEAMGDATGALTERRKDELDALNKLSPKLAATQALINMVDDIKIKADKAKALSDSLKVVLNTVTKSIQDTLKASMTMVEDIKKSRTGVDGEIRKASLAGMTPKDRITSLKGEEAELFKQLKTTDNPVAVAAKLQEVILARIGEEVKLNETANNLSKETLKEQISGYEKLKNLANDIKQFTSTMRFGDLSSLNNKDQLGEAKKLFESTMTGVRNGDEDAMSKLTGNAQAYIEEARSYFASSKDYDNIFTSVLGELDAVGMTDYDPILETTKAQLKAMEDVSTKVADGSKATVEALTIVSTILGERQDEFQAKVDEQVQLAKDEIAAINESADAMMEQAAEISKQYGIKLEDINAKLAAIVGNGSLSKEMQLVSK